MVFLKSARTSTVVNVVRRAHSPGDRTSRQRHQVAGDGQVGEHDELAQSLADFLLFLEVLLALHVLLPLHVQRFALHVRLAGSFHLLSVCVCAHIDL